MTEISDHIATRRQIDFDTFKVTYVCGSCEEKVECSLKSAVLRKDLGQYCGDTHKTGLMFVLLDSLPVIDRDYWKGLVDWTFNGGVESGFEESLSIYPDKNVGIYGRRLESGWKNPR